MYVKDVVIAKYESRQTYRFISRSFCGVLVGVYNNSGVELYLSMSLTTRHLAVECHQLFVGGNPSSVVRLTQ